MAVHMPMLCQMPNKTSNHLLGTQTLQRSSQHPYQPSLAASVGTPRNPIDSTTVVAAPNLCCRLALSDGGGLCGVIHISSKAKKFKMRHSRVILHIDCTIFPLLFCCSHRLLSGIDSVVVPSIFRQCKRCLLHHTATLRGHPIQQSTAYPPIALLLVRKSWFCMGMHQLLQIGLSLDHLENI